MVLTRKEVIGENWFMDVTKDVMHNLGKDLHVNVAGDIFYTGGATFQLKLEKDYSAKIGGDFGVEGRQDAAQVEATSCCSRAPARCR